MRINKGGIWRNVTDENELKEYKQDGYKVCGCLEPQPSQEGLYVVDEYTIAKTESL